MFPRQVPVTTRAPGDALSIVNKIVEFKATLCTGPDHRYLQYSSRGLSRSAPLSPRCSTVSSVARQTRYETANRERPMLPLWEAGRAYVLKQYCFRSDHCVAFRIIWSLISSSGGSESLPSAFGGSGLGTGYLNAATCE